MRTKLQPDEELVLIVRQHWIVLLKPLLIVLLVFFAYPELVRLKLLDLNRILEPAKMYVFGAAIVYFLYKFYDRKVNIWAVTNARLIDEWGIITHRAKESPLEKINNVDISQTINGRLFNYGSVAIQTAATSGETWIRYVAKPLILQQAIMRMVRQRQERQDERSNGEEARDVRTLPGPINLNIVKCPHCGGLIPESAFDSLRVTAEPTDAVPPIETATNTSDNGGRDIQGQASTPVVELQPTPAFLSNDTTNIPEAPAYVHHEDDDPFDWKKR